MRKLIVSNLVSADGYFEGPEQDLSWFKIDPEFHLHMAMIFDRVDTILLGRKTYELFSNFWPDDAGDDDLTADFMNHSTKIVFSKTLSKAPWGKLKEAILLKDNLVAETEKLKQQPGKDIVIFGSSTIVSALSQADLIDEYRFIINPVILGDGKQMFKQLNAKHPLKLKAATVLSFGVVVLDYERNWADSAL
jgi:dihydrofolate reductase